MSDVLASALAALIQYLGATPVLLCLTIIIVGPMLTVVWIVAKLDRILGKTTTEQEARMVAVFKRQDDRFEQVVQMYRDNVSLVKSYESHVTNQRETNDKLIDLVSVSTDTQATMVAYIKNNLFCPLVKQRTRPDKIEQGGA